MRAAVLAALLGLLVLPAGARAGGGLADQFICQCGCGLTLATCTHPVCGPRDRMLAAIGRLQNEGRTDAEIRAALVDAYGEAVLSAPPRRGFNLVAWWGPYAALVAGAAAVTALAALWSRRSERPSADLPPALTPGQRAWLERELEQWED